ncbi:DNA polymerase III subunit epsilon [Pelistega indica]|uniref:DNA polymerase III subunit epsilon n=1 Tax=Pelistega indica TaxID=1414851 RepID=V8G9W9_9BURK|nr:DNA polymerase III subunit epsilon [Pelistega indica]ETD72743.1 DNA polymerase III subunit epsilon [Pelistega indica]
MRQIVFDTETTGLKVADGNRVIELGGVELIDRKVTGNNLHLYFNPGRDSEPGALEVHGLTTEFLSQYPPFETQMESIIEFIRGAELVAHNAEFDIGFLNHEFALAGYKPVREYIANVVDTYALAKELLPGVRMLSLDALCTRFDISNEHRVLHGALLDAELLADVYVAMTRVQFGLGLSFENIESTTEQVTRSVDQNIAKSLPIIYANEQELAEHNAYVGVLEKASGGPTLWSPSESIE